jgi:HAD superfamily hydrolase (TIGR01549 family)
MQSSVDAVLFDIDNTLCSYRRTSGDILPLAFESVGVDHFFTAEEYVDRYNEFADESDGIRDLRERCFAAFASERGYDTDVSRAVARAFAAERDHSNVEYCPGARETLSALDGEVPLAAVTNGAPEMQSAKLDGLGLGDFFETVVYAGYDAPAKPSAEPFHLALDALDATPDRTLHVGDSLSSDIAGGHRAGVQTAWVHGEHDQPTAEPDPTPDYSFSTVEELRRLWE